MTTDIPEMLVNGGVIVRRQTTFWEFASTRDPVEVWRVHLRHKAEFYFAQKTFDQLAVVTRHPLLIDHQEPWDLLFVSSRAMDPDAVLRELERLAKQWFQGWRSIVRYLNPLYPAAEVLAHGSGMLLHGPRSFVEACKAVVRENGIRADTPGVPLSVANVKLPPAQALLCGLNYVVAQRFEFERSPDANS